MDYPKPVYSSSRTCFGIDYFDNEKDAETAGDIVTSSKEKYNGGFYNGKKCGRDSSFDFVRNGIKLYAVTRK